MNATQSPDQPPGPETKKAAVRAPIGRGKKIIFTGIVALAFAAAAVLLNEARLRILPDPMIENAILNSKMAAVSKVAAQKFVLPPRWNKSAGDKPPCQFFMRPDGGRPHRMMHNSFGNRQHREFDAAKPAGTRRIIILGDSFCENDGMEAQYSFSEVADFLLNALWPSQRCEIMNFGIGGYGTDQCSLRYFQEAAKTNPDVVMYLFYRNDFRNISQNHIVDITKDGKLFYALENEPAAVRFAKNLARRTGWRTLYQLEGLISEIDNSKDRDDLAKPIFSALIRGLRDDMAAKGVFFFAGIAPAPGPDGNSELAQDLLRKEGVPVFRPIPDLSGVNSILKFSNDEIHWNELGNFRFAAALVDYLRGRFGWNAAPADALCTRASEYYSSFGSIVFDDPSGCVKPVSVAKETGAAIVGKYLALDALFTGSEN